MGSALVIGGTSGLGREIARQAARRGMTTTIAGRTAGDQRFGEPRELNGAFRWTMDLAAVSEDGRQMFQPPSFLNGALSEPPVYVFLVAGIAQHEALTKMTDDQIDRMTATHLNGPIKVIKNLHTAFLARRQPYHLVVVSSTSAFKARDDEELYCALQAGKAAFTAQWVRRMNKDLPGSRATLFMPGGMNSPFWKGSGTDASQFMDPALMAQYIWRAVIEQSERFRAYTIPRGVGGALGPVTPGMWALEPPFTDEMP